MVKSSKRWSKQPSMKSAKKLVTKQRKAKAKRNMDTFFLKTKTLNNVSFTQGITKSNYFYWNSTCDPTGVGAAYLNNAEFQLYRLQYDKFRVNSVTVRVKPKANMLALDQAQNDTAYTLSGDGLIHTCVDRDGSAPSNVSVISRYPSYKSYSLLKPFSRTYNIKYPMGIWLDCENPAGFSMTKELGLSGGLTLYAENVLEDAGELFNEPWAEITVEHNIVFQGKVNTNLGAIYDASGNLIGVSVNAGLKEDNLPLTVPLETNGQVDPFVPSA